MMSRFLLLHGTRDEWGAKIWEQGAISRESAGAYLVPAEALSDADPKTLFTMATAIFHAVGLAGWRAIEERREQHASLYSTLAIIIGHAKSADDLAGAPVHSYVDIEDPLGTHTHPYVHIADAGALAMTKESLRIWTCLVTKLTEALRPEEFQRTPRFFEREGTATNVLSIDTRRVCMELSREAIEHLRLILKRQDLGDRR